MYRFNTPVLLCLCILHVSSPVPYSVFLGYVSAKIALRFCSILCDSYPFSIREVCIKVTLLTGASCHRLFRNCDWRQRNINGRIICVAGVVRNAR
jgi:hypothetical protein